MESSNDDASINFTVLDNGIAILEENGTFSVFSNVPGKSQVKKVVDPSLTTQLQLIHNRMTLLGIDGKRLVQLSMK